MCESARLPETYRPRFSAVAVCYIVAFPKLDALEIWESFDVWQTVVERLSIFEVHCLHCSDLFVRAFPPFARRHAVEDLDRTCGYRLDWVCLEVIRS